VDRGSGILQLPTQGIGPAQGCWSCAIVQSAASQRTVEGADYVAETVNEDAVVLSGPQFAGLVVIPRRCVKGLDELPPLGRARVLAAVRSATVSIRQGNQGPTSRIVVLADPSAPSGHVSFQVLPNGSDDPTSPAPPSSPSRTICRATAVAKADAAR
jgi:hypothetical protein